jgi:flagellar hook-associated protein 1 FlgK
MSLDQAMNIALSGLRANQESLNVLSNNIANANTEGYARRVVSQSSSVQGGISQGVVIDEVRSIVDKTLRNQIVVQQGSSGLADTLNDYNSRIQGIIGNPNSDTSLNVYVDNFFEALRTLSTNTELSSVRLDTVSKGTLLADQLAATAEDLERLRLTADSELRTTITNINQDIDRIFQLNNAIKEANIGGNAALDLVDQRQRVINSLGEKINIQVYEQSDGRVNIATSGGVTLLDDFRRQLSYGGVSSIDTFTNESAVPPVLVYSIKDNGDRIGTPETLVTSDISGASGDITNLATGGRIRALTDMRDIEIPRILDQLDNLAASLRDAFNAIHNEGTGLPPRNQITGTESVAASDQFDFTGQVRIALLNEDGTPIESPYYADNGGYRPLLLDLENLESGYGAGSPTVQDIIDEINYYYGPPPPRVSLGLLTDIKLSMISDQVSTGGNVSFDLELINASAYDAEVTVTGVTITDSLAGAAVATFTNTPFTITAGDRTRTGSDFTASFTDTGGAPPNVPYTVDITIQVQQPDGTIATDTITFTIGASALGDGPGLRNERVAATAVAGTEAVITVSPGGQRLAYAEIVDANGNTITDGVTAGYLRITTQNSSHGIAIDSLDSQQTGSTLDSDIENTGRGFSHFFELNDFFVDNNGTLKNSALNMAVRSDIITNPNNISMGNLTLSSQPFAADTAVYTYELGSSSNQVITLLADLRNAVQNFSSAGTLPASSSTFGGYTADIIAFTATKALQAQDKLDQQNMFKDLYEERFQASSGVNLDEELANTILFQNAFGASSRIVNIVKELFDELLGMIR